MSGLMLVLAFILGALIENPSFEESEGKKPAGWSTVVWQGKGQFQYVKGGRSGTRCVMIGSKIGADAGWQTRVPVEMYAKYRLSGWIRTEGLEPGSGRGALLNVHTLQPVQTEAVKGTTEWTQVEVEFETGGADVLLINCLFGGWGRSTGKAWFDDLSLERLSSRELKPEVLVDANRTRHPISRYIYGQFIEHLGRCIYGGLWAEMLEDRKFYFAPGAEESPWNVIGEMRMDGESPFVGAHTPVITLPGGLAQGGLALIQGKTYTGRVVLAGDGPVEIRLVWGDDFSRLTIEKITSTFEKYPISFMAGGTTDQGRLEILGKEGRLHIGTASLMPGDHVMGFRSDTLKLLKELDAPVYRWPGGNFVSGYDWKDGIGDPDRRPPRKNPAWKGIEHNDVGMHEFIALCRLLDTEPYIAVNTGLGSVASAAEQVEYANGGPDTPMGKRRAANGDVAPFGVKFWAIGNEMYGGWQLGHMPLEEYVKKHNEVAAAMRACDPSIQRVGVGSVGRWSKAMLAHCADSMELISEHFYCQELPGLSGHVLQVPRRIRTICDAHRNYGKQIPIAMDEWNYWYGPHVYGELGTRYFLKDALGIAAGLHEYYRNSDLVFMANYAQTVNVIGCIKTSKTDAAFATTGLVLKLYRKRFGSVPVEITGSMEPLDVAAAWTEDRKTFTLSIINPTRTAYDFPVKGIELGAGKQWQITGPDEMAYNEPGKAPRVRIVEGAADLERVKPLSITLYAFED
jgi:alpha-N-arabinofuranosidase